MITDHDNYIDIKDKISMYQQNNRMVHYVHTYCHLAFNFHNPER